MSDATDRHQKLGIYINDRLSNFLETITKELIVDKYHHNEIYRAIFDCLILQITYMAAMQYEGDDKNGYYGLIEVICSKLKESATTHWDMRDSLRNQLTDKT